MSRFTDLARRQQWVTGGRYAVAVEVDVVIPADDPTEPCLTPATVRHLEWIADRAEAGDLAALGAAGTVYELAQAEGAA